MDELKELLGAGQYLVKYMQEIRAREDDLTDFNVMLLNYNIAFINHQNKLLEKELNLYDASV